MHRILKKIQLNSEICLVEFDAPDIASAARAGQFVILRIDEFGERFPLTLYDWDVEKGTISVVCQAVGVSTRKLSSMIPGDSIPDISGPLGHAVDVKNKGNVVCIGGGVGAAEAFPIARAMHKGGNDVTVIIGARTKDLIVCEKEVKAFCDKVYITTDDGSYGRKGYVSDILGEIMNENIGLVFAIGPVPMMKVVSEVTRPFSVETRVSLNSIMVDGTGMCGVCRIQYKGERKFTCCDGPDFDAHGVDFEDLTHRINQYRDKEKKALEHYNKNCRIGYNK